MASSSNSSSTTTSNMISEEGILIGALVAFTIQIIRLSMDLVQVASKTTPKASAAVEKTVEKTVVGGTYGSITNGTTSSTEEDEEQALLLGDDDNGNGNGDVSNTTNIRLRMRMFSACWIALSALFIAASMGNAVAKSNKNNNITYTEQSSQSSSPSSSPFLIFSTPLLVLSALTMLLQLWLHLRDVDRDRYGCAQRFLQLSAAVTLWILYALLEWNNGSNTTSNTMGVVVYQVVVMVAATLAVIVSLLDGWTMTSRRKFHQEQHHASKLTTKPSVFLQLLKPYFWPDATDSTAVANRFRAIATWFCVIASKVCGLLSPLYLGWATTSLAHGDYRATIRYSVLYSLVSFAGTTLKEGQSLVYLKVAQAAFVQLSEAAFAHLHSLSLDWHLRKKLGEVLRSMDRGIAACDTLMKYLFLWLVPAMAECLTVVIIFATYFNYLPLALTIFYFVFLYVLWTILLTLWRKKFRKALVQHDNEYHDIFTDSMVNFETVKHFTAEEFEKKRFADAVSNYQAGSTDVQASLSFLNISQQVILKTCLAVALSLAAVGIRQRGTCCVETMGCESAISDCCLAVSKVTCPGMQVGDFVAVLTYTLNLFAPLNFLGSVYNAIVMALIDLNSMSELLAEQPDVVDADDAIYLPRTNSQDPDTAIEFDNVHFHYPTQPLANGLKGLSFKMKRGTTTAIVGPTGAGKTTVSRLLFRFYDVLGGAVKVNGVDVRSLKQKSLRGAIGVVPQAASMFNDTIRYNLKYGRRDATQDEIEQASKDAQILGFINSLDDGWETMVGDRGMKLSGGEKQRAAIARCLLKDPPFVLLDEATSALDTITEKSVQQALDRLGTDRTVLVIAHRLGTIRNADNIIVLKDGMVAEQGTHDELLRRKNGVYAEMWNMQLHTTSSL